MMYGQGYSFCRTRDLGRITRITETFRSQKFIPKRRKSGKREEENIHHSLPFGKLRLGVARGTENTELKKFREI